MATSYCAETQGTGFTATSNLLLERAHIAAVDEVLRDHGYAQRRIAANHMSIEPLDRAPEAFWRLHVNNAPPFRKLSRRLEVGLYEVDVCFDLFQAGGSGRIPVKEMLNRRVPMSLYGQSAYGLSLADQSSTCVSTSGKRLRPGTTSRPTWIFNC